MILPRKFDTELQLMATINKITEAQSRGLVSETALAGLLLHPPSKVRRIFASAGVMPDETHRAGTGTLRLYGLHRLRALENLFQK